MKGYVYAIKSHQTDEIYIGSTTRNLNVRLREHHYEFGAFLDDKRSYKTSYEMFQYSDVFIELLEEVEVENVKELRLKEGEHIRKNKCVNLLIAGRTDNEYTRDNKDKLKEYSEKYREANKDKIKESQKRYDEEHKEEKTEYHKKWYEENKEQINKKGKEYYEANKQNHVCECGGVYNKINKKRHEGRLIHRTFIDKNNFTGV